MKNAESAIPHSYSSFTYTDKYILFKKKSQRYKALAVLWRSTPVEIWL